MVRKLILGARQHGKAIVVVAALLAVALLLVLSRAASAAPPDPFHALAVSGQPCGGCDSCGSCGPDGRVHGVDVIRGTSRLEMFLFEKVGLHGRYPFSIAHDGSIDGAGEFGRSNLASWQTTIQYVVLDSGNPSGPSGHKALARFYDGRIVSFMWGGSSYSTSDCGERSVLTKSGSIYTLTGTHGEFATFDADGMPATIGNLNGTLLTLSYSNKHLQSITTDRGETIAASLDTDNYVDELDDPWTFSYDSSNRLTSIVTPASADQTSGITRSLGYDSSHRLTSYTDGRGNATTYAYVSTSLQVASVTLNSQTTSFSYGSGYTDVTDPVGNVHRYYYSSNQITKVCLRVSGADAFATEYRYSGSDLTTVVYPRGNRLDITRDSSGNVTERRRRTADTSTNASSDIVESWGFNSGNFSTSYTDPLGNVTTYTRSSAGNVTAIGFPNVTVPATQSSVSKSFTFNSAGQKTYEVDEDGKETQWTYFSSGSNAGLLQKVEVDPYPIGLTLTTTYGYDSAGNVNSVTDPRGKVMTTTWDALRRRTEVTAPAPLYYRTQFHYDANGNLTSKDVENFDKDGSVVTANQWLSSSPSCLCLRLDN